MGTAIDEYKGLVRRNKPIVYNGLTFNPLKVEQIALYQSAKPSFELMQSSLPPQLAILSWCECLDALDRQSHEEGKNTIFLATAMIVIAIATGLPQIDGTYPIREVRRNDGKLLSFLFGQLDNPTIISMKDMDEIRKIIAAQNLYDIPDESWNPDLVRARKYLAANSQVHLNVDFDDLVYSVALNAHVNPSEIWDWTIRDFVMTQDAIDRTLNYQIFTTAEHSGFVKFINRNPYPTWKYNKKYDMPAEFKTIEEYDEEAKGLLGVTEKEI
ncbi:MAG: hypothetical protein IKZ39_08460 [Lachnospiraceae bacterium]|nr:hypothetical protein [Lachnospiraceae bacterium]